MAVVGVADERAGQLPRVFIVPGDNLTKEAVTILINKKNTTKTTICFHLHHYHLQDQVYVCLHQSENNNDKIKCMFIFISQKTIMKKKRFSF